MPLFRFVIDKTGAIFGANWQEQLKQISCGSSATLEDAWGTLRHLVELSPTSDDDPTIHTERESNSQLMEQKNAGHEMRKRIRQAFVLR